MQEPDERASEVAKATSASPVAGQTWVGVSGGAPSLPPAGIATEVSQHVKDTRLNAAMRALLAIIAGLIIGDMLKGAVATIRAGATTRTDACANAFVVVAATFFVLRVLTDNVLYYNDPDAVTKDDAYELRVSLIVCDLVSYALCYAVVACLVNDSLSVVAGGDVVSAVALFFAVETLHCAWCCLALGALRGEPETDSRKPLLRLWRRLSGTWAVAWLGTAAVVALMAEWSDSSRNVEIGVATLVLLASFGSAWHYLRRLRPHYMGRAMASAH